MPLYPYFFYNPAFIARCLKPAHYDLCLPLYRVSEKHIQSAIRHRSKVIRLAEIFHKYLARLSVLFRQRLDLQEGTLRQIPLFRLLVSLDV